MKTSMMKLKWLGAALLAIVGLTARAKAAGVGTPSVLNIDVTITASKSVSVNGVNSSTDAATIANWNGTPNQQFVPASTTSVKNDSGILSEGWELSTNANSIDTTAGGQTWALAASTSSVGADQFALQAVFGSSSTAAGGCPAAGGAEWGNGTTAPPLTAAVAQYTSTQFADSNLNAGGGVSYEPDNTVNNKMFAFQAASGVGLRVLCWRAIMPATTSTQHQQNLQVIVTAL